jgi:hypothetical protein
VNIEPKAQPGPFIEAGWNWGSYFATAFFEYMKFEESDPETIFVAIDDNVRSIPFSFLQPESEVRVIGAEFGWHF